MVPLEPEPSHPISSERDSEVLSFGVTFLKTQLKILFFRTLFVSSMSKTY